MLNYKKRHLLKCSLELFMKLGPRAVTMDEIAQRTGISKKTVYLYFRDKNDLVNTLYSKVIEIMEWRLKNIFITEENAVEQYIKIIELGLIGQTYMNTLTVDDMKRFFQVSNQKLQNFIENKYSPALCESIEAGRKQGLYQPDFDTGLLAEICISHLKYYMKGAGTKLPDLSVQDIKKQVITHLVCGMATPAGKKQVNQYFSINQ